MTMTLARAKEKLREIGTLYRQLPWDIGDLYLALESQFGEKLPGVAVQIGLSEYQLYDFVRMSNLWPRADRVYALPWSYYRDAGGDIEVARRLLSAADRQGWSRDQIRAARKLLKEKLDDRKPRSTRRTNDSIAKDSGQLKTRDIGRRGAGASAQRTDDEGLGGVSQQDVRVALEDDSSDHVVSRGDDLQGCWKLTNKGKR